MISFQLAPRTIPPKVADIRDILLFVDIAPRTLAAVCISAFGVNKIDWELRDIGMEISEEHVVDFRIPFLVLDRDYAEITALAVDVTAFLPLGGSDQKQRETFVGPATDFDDFDVAFCVCRYYVV